VFREPGALLARMAHDLELAVGRLSVREAEDHRVEVEFDPASLTVTGALTNGVVDPSRLDASQRAEIEKNVRTQVLKTDQFSRAHFEGMFDPTRAPVPVSGTLELLGKRQPIAFELSRHAEWFVGTLTLAPSRWGITPYRALLGALKLRDTAVVRVEVEATPTQKT
jgi:polyisoprenoid-binding protein YceI